CCPSSEGICLRVLLPPDAHHGRAHARRPEARERLTAGCARLRQGAAHLGPPRREALCDERAVRSQLDGVAALEGGLRPRERRGDGGPLGLVRRGTGRQRARARDIDLLACASEKSPAGRALPDVAIGHDDDAAHEASQRGPALGCSASAWARAWMRRWTHAGGWYAHVMASPEMSARSGVIAGRTPSGPLRRR